MRFGMAGAVRCGKVWSGEVGYGMAGMVLQGEVSERRTD